MKKHLLAFALTLGFGSAFSQAIPNGSFENWTTTNYNYLTKYKFQDCNYESLRRIGQACVTQTADPFQGSFAIKLQTKTNGIDTAFGFFINGMPCGPGNPNPGGIPYTGMPTGFTGRFKCSVPVGDTALVIVVFKKNSNVMANGFYIKKFYGSQAAYAPFSFSIALGSAPDTVIIGGVSSNIMGGGNGKPGSMLQVDSINFKGAVNPANMDGSFESWATGSYNSLNNWQMAGDSVTRSTSAFTGTYAVLMQATDNGGGCGGGGGVNFDLITTGKLTPTGTKGGYPYTLQNDSLIGYYKFAPVGNDTAQLWWNASKLNSPIGGGVKIFTLSTGGVYKRFTTPIILGTAPDSLLVNIQAGKWPGQATMIGSKLWIDGLQLKSAPLSVPLIFMGPQYNMSVYPNPSKGLINLVYDSESSEPVTLQVFNEVGQIVMSQNLMNKGAKNLIDLTTYAKGLYLLKTEQSGHVSTSRIIVE